MENKKITKISYIVKNNKGHDTKLTFREHESGATPYGCNKAISVDYEDLETKEKITNYKSFDVRYSYGDFKMDVEYFALWFIATKWMGFIRVEEGKS